MSLSSTHDLLMQPLGQVSGADLGACGTVQHQMRTSPKDRPAPAPGPSAAVDDQRTFRPAHPRRRNGARAVVLRVQRTQEARWRWARLPRPRRLSTDTSPCRVTCRMSGHVMLTSRPSYMTRMCRPPPLLPSRMILRSNLPRLRKGAADARVLDIGGSYQPFNLATHVIDLCPYSTQRRHEAIDPEDVERFTADTWVVADVCAPPWPYTDNSSISWCARSARRCPRPDCGVPRDQWCRQSRLYRDAVATA